MDEWMCSEERWTAPPSLHPDYRPGPLGPAWRRHARDKGRWWLGSAAATILVVLGAALLLVTRDFW